jgi:hypothetical protein
MSSLRLRERIPSARSLGAARLAGWRLAPNKRGRDGSGKANITRDDGGEVWGALYRLDPDHWEILDRFERGYRRISLDVANAGEVVRASSYRSTVLSADAVAFDWYRQLMLDGAREHGLPEHWIAALRTLPVRADPSRS